MSEDSTGNKLTADDYIKLEKLGEGAFGEVFKARKKYSGEVITY